MLLFLLSLLFLFESFYFFVIAPWAIIIINGYLIMAKIKLKVYGLFREKTGIEEIEVTGENFLEILNSLAKGYPILRSEIFDENMKLKENVYLLNGRNVFLLEGVETEVKEGDTIAIFPIITGG